MLITLCSWVSNQLPLWKCSQILVLVCKFVPDVCCLQHFSLQVTGHCIWLRYVIMQQDKKESKSWTRNRSKNIFPAGLSNRELISRNGKCLGKDLLETRKLSAKIKSSNRSWKRQLAWRRPREFFSSPNMLFAWEDCLMWFSVTVV